MATNLIYRPDIDGLRALAILPVLLFHVGIPAFSGGYIGVDIFFVISGYLITGIIFKEISAGNFSFIKFYERRARRILPALAVVLLSSIVVGWWLMLPEDYLSMNKSIIAAILSVSNVYFWRQTGYFADASELFPLLHTWSLGVEEQFYIGLPVLLLLLFRAKRGVAGVVLLSIVIGSFVLCLWLQTNKPSANFYLLPSRAWELLVGSLIAIFGRQPTHSRCFRECAAVVGILAVLVPVFIYTKHTPFPGWPTVIPVAGTGILLWLLCGQGQPTVVARILSTKLLVQTGLISYSLYLWHWPVIVFLRQYEATFELTPIVMLVAIALSFTLAYLSYRYIERPFRSPFTVSKRAVFTASAGMLTTICSIALGLALLDGVPSRVNSKSLAIVSNSKRGLADEMSCINSFKVDPQPVSRHCQVGDVTVPEVLVLGDSHATALLPAFRYINTLHGMNFGVANFHACPPLDKLVYGVHPRPERLICAARTEKSLAYIEHEPAIQKVLLVAFWPAYLKRDDAYLLQGESESRPTDAQVAYWAALNRTIERIQSAGKRVFIVAGLPEPKFDVAWTIAKQLMLNKAPTSLLTYSDENSVMVSMAHIAQTTGAELIDVSKALCVEGTCRLLEENQVIFRDTNHLSAYGASTYVGPYLAERLSLWP